MKIDNNNDVFKLAFHFVNDTQRSLYLTGKAGTGKTTFLRYIKETCAKNMVIVAPTGVAAINAGGVTMHSFFQLPFKPFVPYMPQGFGRNEQVVDRNNLLKNIRFNTNKRKLLQELDLLVIDEVSMLRADMLEAMNVILKAFRKNNKPFGGVQMLFIGDLYQLPPVVVESEKLVMEQHYKSPYFFDAPVMQEIEPLYVELKTIYRQSDMHFIQLLNRIRNNDMEEEHFINLNERYNPRFEPQDKKYITITSHNYKADAINQAALQKLTTRSFQYHGTIDGDFGDKQLPTDRVLHLKEGAQIMFIKNDSGEERKYFNGKLATITKLKEEEIEVEFTVDKEKFILNKETWENINYEHDADKNEIVEKKIGQFIQYPIRLAWAITIHKSQGLTFENAIIDAGDSFAPGQVYVALSRCTNLEGMVLRSRILPSSIHSDTRIENYSENEASIEQLKQALPADIMNFQNEKLRGLFDFAQLCFECRTVFQTSIDNKSLMKQESITEGLEQIADAADQINNVANRYIMELDSLIKSTMITNDEKPLLNRTEKAIQYFAAAIRNDLIKPLEIIFETLGKMTGVKKYAIGLKELELACWNKIESLYNARYNHNLICERQQIKVDKSTVVKTAKREKGQSAKETLVYFMAGKTIEEIAKLKSIAVSTTESHLAEFIKTGELDIHLFLKKKELDEILPHVPQSPPYSLTELHKALNEKYSYGQLRMAISYFILKKKIPDQVKAN